MSGKYELYYDTIGTILAQIAKGQHEHSYAIIPQISYDDWKKRTDFQGEESYKATGDDGIERDFSKTKFKDLEHDWAIVTTKCKHPNPTVNGDWRFIINVTKDDQELSCSQMGIEDFTKYINK